MKLGKQSLFPLLLRQLEEHFEGRMAIDTAIAESLGTSAEQSRISALYDTLATRIKGLGDLLTKA